MIMLSIIIPCYNTGDYIGHCIESLKTQPFDNVEFIFVNDGSTDSTLEQIKAFACIDDRVVYVDKQNEGVSAARNDALRIAKGEYIFLLDSDDYLSDDAIEVIKNAIEEVHFDLLISNINIVKGNIKQYNHKIVPGCYTPYDLYKNCISFPVPPQLVYKTEIIKKHHILFDTNIYAGEVYVFTVQFMQFASSVFVVNDAFYNYIQRDESAIHNPNYKKDITSLTAINRLYLYGNELAKATSFHTTAFATTVSFTYIKYVRNKITDDESKAVIKMLFNNKSFNRALIKTAFYIHHNPKKRCLALYMYFTRMWGYRSLIWINKWINFKNV